jgi:hypothetical protein
MEQLRSITKVTAKAPDVLAVVWSDGVKVELSLAKVLRTKAYKALKDEKLFAKAALGDWGHSVVWPGDIELGADSLWRMTLEATGRTDTLEFIDWRTRHGLSLTDAANALGVSRRMVAYYASGEREVPKTVLLACKGWEVSAA